MKMKLFYFCYLLITAIFISINIRIFNLIYTEQPEPYIDEIFHLNQTQDYCEYNFMKWNSKISTPPGLYVVSVLFIKMYYFFTGINACTLYGMRMVNLILSCSVFPLIFRIMNAVNPYSSDEDKWKDLFVALVVSNFPVLYFYSFLYYTDYLSLYLILLMYYAHLHDHNTLSDVFGLLSVLVRQTNLAWLMFLVIAKLYTLINAMSDSAPSYMKRRDNILFKLRIAFFLLFSSRAKEFVTQILFVSRGLILSVTFLASSYILNGFSFAYGDQNAHTLTIHLNQYIYFFVFFLFFHWPYFLLKMKQFIPRTRGTILSKFCHLFIMAAVVTFGTHIHIYLLSDNRHYMFYIWKNFLKYSWIRYCLIPAQMFSIYCIYDNVKYVDYSYQLGYIVAIFMCLVPHKLLEFRYFIIPYIMLRLHMKRGFWWQLFLEFLISAIINYAVIYTFLYRPFYWPDGTKQRFSW